MGLTSSDWGILGDKNAPKPVESDEQIAVAEARKDG